MLRLAFKLPARSQNLFQYAAFNSSAPINSLRPPLDLDPSLQALLKEEDITLKHTKVLPKILRELEVVDNLTLMEHQLSLDDWKPMDVFDTIIGRPGERKSPAALFGSQRIGMVILPSELQSAIKQLIAGMHPVKMAIMIVHIGSQMEINHKFAVMPNDCFNLIQRIQRNLCGTPSMKKTIIPNSKLFAMLQETELPLLLLLFRRIIPP